MAHTTTQEAGQPQDVIKTFELRPPPGVMSPDVGSVLIDMTDAQAAGVFLPPRWRLFCRGPIPYTTPKPWRPSR